MPLTMGTGTLTSMPANAVEYLMPNGDRSLSQDMEVPGRVAFPHSKSVALGVYVQFRDQTLSRPKSAEKPKLLVESFAVGVNEGPVPVTMDEKLVEKCGVDNDRDEAAEKDVVELCRTVMEYRMGNPIP